MGEKVNADRFLLKKPESDHLEYLDLNGRTILKLALKKRNGTAWTGMHLARESDKCRAVLNTAMKLLVPLNAENLTS